MSSKGLFEWIDWLSRAPTMASADVFGYVLSRRVTKAGQPWYEARPINSKDNEGWQWLDLGEVVRIDRPNNQKPS